MDSYCNINEAYNNKGILSRKNESDELERMARKINENKKQSKDIYKQFRKNNSSLSKSAKAFNELQNSHNDKATMIGRQNKQNNMTYHPGAFPIINDYCDNKSGGFYNAQGDYTLIKQTDDQYDQYDQNMQDDPDDETYALYKPKSMTGTLIKDIYKGSSYPTKHSAVFASNNINNSNDDSGLTIETPSNNSSSDASSADSVDSADSADSADSSFSSISSLTLNTREIDKEVKTKSKFDTKKRSKRHKCMDFDLDSVESLESLDSGESLLRHIRFCSSCKDKLMTLIKKQRLSSHANNHKNALEKFKKGDKSKCLQHILNSPELSDASSDTQANDSEEEQIIVKKDKKNVTFCSENTKNTNNINKDDQKYVIPELKEIVTICLIGFLVIMILDLMINNR